MADISEEELKIEIEKILKGADLTTTSAKTVRQELEKKLGVDLVERKNVIRQLVVDYVDNMPDKDDEDEEESEEEEEEEEEVKKPVKRAAPPPKKQVKKKKKESTEEESEASEPEEKSKKKKRVGADSDSDWDKKKKKAAKPKKAAGGGRGKGSGYTRTYKLSPSLAELMGKEEMPRHEVVKRMWQIIKEKQLYDPNNKQFAICDDALYKVFGTKRFRTFGMMKYLKTHFLDD